MCLPLTSDFQTLACIRKSHSELVKNPVVGPRPRAPTLVFLTNFPSDAPADDQGTIL